MIEIKVCSDFYDKYSEEVDRTAVEFFDLLNDDSQIDADERTFRYSLEIGGITIIALEDDVLLGWCFAFPTNTDLMKRFVNNEITEYELFWSTEKDENYDAIYLCAIYVFEKHRSRGIGKMLTDACLQPLLKDSVTVFYEPYSEEGKRLGESVLKDVKYKVIVKQHGT
jgi:GNAT superfamily N-acetyltransferase